MTKYSVNRRVRLLENGVPGGPAISRHSLNQPDAPACSAVKTIEAVRVTTAALRQRSRSSRNRRASQTAPGSSSARMYQDGIVDDIARYQGTPSPPSAPTPT